MMQKRVSANNGLNIPASQYTNLEKMRHETIITPSTSNPSWGGYFIIDLKEKNCMIHNLTLRFSASAITGLTAGSAHYTPAWFWFNRIELTMNNNVIDTIYGNSQFLLHQLFNFDEKRKFLNVCAGDYASVAQRTALASTANDYYVPIWSFFKQTHLTAINPKDDIQLRIYMDTKSNNIVTSSDAVGVPSSTLNACSLLTQISRLESSSVNAKFKELVRIPQHYQFSQLRYGTYNISAGSQQTSIVLSALVGPVSFLIFTLRPTNSVSGDGYFNYLPIKDFAILDSGSTNIVGGQSISSTQALCYLNRDWTRSSYSTETAISSTNNNAYVYMYSFGISPDDTIHTGKTYNNHRFIGSEQLQLTFPTVLTSAVQLDVYAHIDSAIEYSSTYVKTVTI